MIATDRASATRQYKHYLKVLKNARIKLDRDERKRYVSAANHLARRYNLTIVTLS